jgi:hypothetical protein
MKGEDHPLAIQKSQSMVQLILRFKLGSELYHGENFFVYGIFIKMREERRFCIPGIVRA